MSIAHVNMYFDILVKYEFFIFLIIIHVSSTTICTKRCGLARAAYAGIEYQPSYFVQL